MELQIINNQHIMNKSFVKIGKTLTLHSDLLFYKNVFTLNRPRSKIFERNSRDFLALITSIEKCT